VKLNLNLNIGNGYLDGDATTDSMSYKINIQQGWPDTTLIVPSDLNLNAGQTSISFYTESGNQILLRTNVKNEDTDMIRLFKSGNLSTVNKGTANSYGHTRFRYSLNMIATK